MLRHGSSLYRPLLMVACACWLFVLSMAPVMAQSRTEVLNFARNATSITIDASIRGRESVDYIVRASAGQTMRVGLESDNLDNYFNVLPPGGGDAMFIGSVSGTLFENRLRRDGDHVLRVYLTREAARRGEVANFRLTVRVTGRDVTPPAPPPPSPGTGDLWEVYGLRAGDTLNMRAGPGTRFRVLDTFANSTVLRNFGCAVTETGAEWCEVSRNQRGALSGWVSARFIRAAGRPPRPPVEPPAPPPPVEVSGEVKCSLLLPVFRKTCAVTVVFDRRQTSLTVRNPVNAGSRTLVFDGRTFAARDGTPVQTQSLGDQYLVIVGDIEFYLVPVSLLEKR